MKLEINIFTNSMISSPSTKIIENTYKSIIDTFGSDYKINVYCDSHPNIRQFNKYFEALKKLFPTIYKTESLSDGYIKSIKDSDADYLFQIEGDWQFNKNLIKHSLEEICAMMEAFGAYHLRFNKRANIISGWDIGLEECSFDSFKFCKTSVLSNNPHIIQTELYRKKCLPLIKLAAGSKGIEENLTHVGLTGCIYGEKNYPATIKHLDGRRLK